MGPREPSTYAMRGKCFSWDPWHRGTPAAGLPAGLPAAVASAHAATRGAREPMRAREGAGPPGALSRIPPCRPPSRPDRRPRAGGTRGSVRAHPGRAARASMSGVNRTCVRTVRAPSDGMPRTYVRTPPIATEIARLSQIGRLTLQQKLRCRWAMRCSMAVAADRAGSAAPCANSKSNGCYPWLTTPRRPDPRPQGALEAHGEVRHRRRRPALRHAHPGR